MSMWRCWLLYQFCCYHSYVIVMKVMSSETIPSSVDLVDPNLRNLASEVAIKVKT